LALDYLPQLGYRKRIHLMNPMVPAINAKPGKKAIKSDETEKMSSSDPKSKIDLLDNPHDIKKKIMTAYSQDRDISFNPLLQLYKMVIFPLNSERHSIIIDREEKYGGSISFRSFDELQCGFINGSINSPDLKIFAFNIINSFLQPIRETFQSEDLQQLLNSAYPDN